MGLYKKYQTERILPTILSGQKVSVHYELSKQKPWDKQRFFEAVKEVDFEIKENSVFSLIGESGSGKTTLGNAVLGFIPIHQGSMIYKNRDLTEVQFRGDIQAVFQNPYSSLNPRKNIFEIVSEPYSNNHPTVKHAELEEVTLNILKSVGMNSEALFRYPHQFSGGQRQRISIARALISDPSLIILDEPVSSLDVSIRAQILNLLADLKEEKELSYFFISHDLATVRYLADHTAIIYRGRILERGSTIKIFQNPQNPYTIMLLESAKEILSSFEAANREESSAGCPFYSRCPKASQICKTNFPSKTKLGEDHEVFCHHL